MGDLFQLFHQAEDKVDLPQRCQRCDREIVPESRMPFVPGQLVLDTWDMSTAPPGLVRRQPIDSPEKPSGSPWCTEVAGLPD
jgi:hypothetical protein